MRLEGMHGINFGIPFVQRSDDTELMPNHISGSSHSFNQLLAAFTADSQADDDAHFLLYRGEEILALCLRFKFNPVPHEVWVGDDPVLAEWGRKLADLKGKKTVPVYYSQRGRRLYEYKDHHLITGDTDDAHELAQRRGPVPLSRVVFIKPVERPVFQKSSRL